eukprot:369176_1
MSKVHSSDGPSLSMDRYLCRFPKSQEILIGLQMYDSGLADSSKQPNNIKSFMAILNLWMLGIFGAFVLVLVGILLFFHLYLICSNLTTIEDFQLSRLEIARWDTPRRDGNHLLNSKNAHKHIKSFDMGTRLNMLAIFGNNPLLWLYPNVPAGDGIAFPIK